MALLGLTVFVYNFIYLDFKYCKPSILIIGFVLFSLIGTSIYSHDFRKWFSLVLLAISFFIFVHTFRVIRKKELIIGVIASAFFLFSLYFIWYYRSELINFKDVIKGKFRLGNYFDNPNGVSAYAVVGFSSALYSLLFIKKPFRFFFIFPVLTNAIVGVATGSKSFIFACLLFTVVILYFVFKKHKLIYLISVVVLFGIFVLLLQLPFMATIKERIVNAFLTIFGKADKADTATIERTIWFDYGLFLGFKNGLFGYGVSGFSLYSGVGTYTHSNVSEVLCDFGYIGFVLFYLPLIILLLKAIFDKNVDKPLIICFVIYYVFIGISNVFYYKKVYYMILAICFYMAYFEGNKKNMCLMNKDIKKIVFTCDTLSSGGAERVIASLANEFSTRGINIHVIGVSDTGMVKPFYDLKDVEYIPLCKSYNKKPMFIKRVFLLRKTIKTILPEVVISFLPHINVYTTCSLIGMNNICHIVSERNNPISDPAGVIRKIAKRISFDFADGCVFQSTGAQKAYPEPIQEKSTIILNPINVSILPQRCKKKSNVFVNVGRFTNQKNQKSLIEAFVEFNKKYNNKYILKLYGCGPLKDELIKLSSNEVIICDPDNKWLEKEKDSRCFILSSDYEGLPNSLMEALSIGMPCISSNCEIGGPQELYDKGFNFLLYKPGDKEELVKSMEMVVDDHNYIYEDNISFANEMNVGRIAEEWLSYIKSI